MTGNMGREPMLDMFIFETTQLIEQLEQVILESEKEGSFSSPSINEIFRIMHTIKGSSAMMLYNGVSKLSHSMEDVFYFIREQKPQNINYSRLFDLVLKVVDFIKSEIAKIEENANVNTDSSFLVNEIKEYLLVLKGDSNSIMQPHETKTESAPEENQKFYISSYKKQSGTDKKLYKAVITFEPGCEMENVRAFSIVHSLKGTMDVIEYEPADIIENPESAEIIREKGFTVIFAAGMPMDEVKEILGKTVFLKDLDISEFQENKSKNQKKIILEEDNSSQVHTETKSEPEKGSSVSSKQSSFISVNIQKLDKLMDLVGELVITEAMVTRNPEVLELGIESFQKASRQHRKIITEIQDMVMSVRMVPLAATFQKMNRIVRDMSKKLDKEVQLEIIGEDTEVDKNIIENISDPLMHLIRNSIDHGLEDAEERRSAGKSEAGKVTLEAKNAGSDVIISVSDDGRGINSSKIYQKAYFNGLTNKSEAELTEKEIFSFIFLPGFSMKDSVTEFSGRGVGMDVVVKNIEKIGGAIEVISKENIGTTINLKIPLTLAIIDGMIVTVGSSSYIIPLAAIKESFRPKENEIITDPDGNEMILIRGKCYPIIRLHEQFRVKTDITSPAEGIVLMVESESESACLLADALIGEQQVVVKSLPKYVKKVKGIAGCTLLGDGSISLIIDLGVLVNNRKER